MNIDTTVQTIIAELKLAGTALGEPALQAALGAVQLNALVQIIAGFLCFATTFGAVFFIRHCMKKYSEIKEARDARYQSGHEGVYGIGGAIAGVAGVITFGAGLIWTLSPSVWVALFNPLGFVVSRYIAN